MINALSQFATAAWQVTCDTASEIKSGLLTLLSDDGVYICWRIYSLDGFENWTKAMVSNLEFLALVPTTKRLFAKCKESFDQQKELYYATLTFGVFNLLVKRDVHGNAIGFQLPKLKEEEGGGTDWSMLSLCIAAIFDSLQFCRKYNVLELAYYSKVMGPLGAYCKINQIPVVQSLFDGKPKEFFIVLSSIIDGYRGFKKLAQLWNCPTADRDRYWTMQKWEAFFQIGASFGKIVGLACYRRYAGHVWLAIVGLIGSHSSLYYFMLSHHRRRMARNEFPVPPSV